MLKRTPFIVTKHAVYYDKTRYLLWQNTLFIMTKHAIYCDKARYLFWHNMLFIMTKYAVYCDTTRYLLWQNTIFIVTKTRYLLWQNTLFIVTQHAIYCDKIRYLLLQKTRTIYCDKNTLSYFDKTRYLLWLNTLFYCDETRYLLWQLSTILRCDKRYLSALWLNRFQHYCFGVKQCIGTVYVCAVCVRATCETTFTNLQANVSPFFEAPGVNMQCLRWKMRCTILITVACSCQIWYVVHKPQSSVWSCMSHTKSPAHVRQIHKPQNVSEVLVSNV